MSWKDLRQCLYTIRERFVYNKEELGIPIISTRVKHTWNQESVIYRKSNSKQG